MTSIETLIGNLLLRHNCVIVPSFGGFVAKQLSAKIDYSSGRMMPPSKALLFNKNLINNDGLLINELALSNSLSFNDAQKQVQEKVNQWNTLLKSGQRIELDRVGFIFLDEERNICFEQDRFFNLLLQSFGLGKVHFLSEEDVKIVEREHFIKTVEEKTIEVVEKEDSSFTPKVSKTEIESQADIAATETSVIEHPAIAKNRSSTWKYIAAACFLPIAFYSIWIPMKTDVLESGVISIKDFNPFKKSVESTYTPENGGLNKVVFSTNESSLQSKIEEVAPNVAIYTYKFDETYFVPVKVKLAESKEILTVDNEKVSEGTSETIEIQTVNYIVGCFADKTNAINLVEKLQSTGLKAQIVDYHNGLHRVSAGGAMTIEGLENIKMTASSLGLSGWILK